MVKSRRKHSCLSRLLLLLLVILLAGSAVGLLVIPLQLERIYKLQATDLTVSQRIIYSYELYRNRELLTKSNQSQAEVVHFNISEGESVERICLRLEEQGLIPSSELFRMFLIYFGMDRSIQSGSFTLSKALNSVSIAKIIIDPMARDTYLAVLPGWRLEEIAASLELSGIAVSKDAFLAYTYSPPGNVASILGENQLVSLEGFLFPGNYPVQRDFGLEQIILMPIEAFNTAVTPGLRQAYQDNGLSLVEAVTMASIIQRESTVSEEYGLIASVFYNRLAAGMPLETDPTVQYALGFFQESGSWWKSPLYISDLGVDSPYNTYLISGLPPGPISNPGLAALTAVANPAQSSYYYFRAKCDGSGSHHFSVSYEEHLRNACP